VYDVNGNLTAIFDSWNSIYYNKRVNDFGYHTISIDGQDSRKELFGDDCFIQVLRSHPELGIDWYEEYLAFHRSEQDQVTDRGDFIFSSFGRGMEDLLHRRAVLYPSGTGGTDKAGPADDVMKNIVRENVGANALIANARIRDGVTLGFSVAPNLSQAPNWEGAFAFRNVLEVLQDIVKAVQFDFSVVWLGGQSFEFRTHYPRIGSDRSGAGTAPATVFALDRANMLSPYATRSRTEEVNVVIVLGQGEETNREFVVREDTAARLISPWNTVEKTHDARNTDTVAGLQAVGDAQLKEQAATRHISFQVIESEATLYGRDFFLGDLILANFSGLTETKKIVGIENTISNGRENIRVHFDDE
jgi:hypothetical protein